MTRVLYAVLIAACAGLQVWAYSGGITGRTTIGCTCHGSSPSSATTLSLSGPTAVSPGSTTTFTLTLQNSGRPAAGFNLAIVNSQGANAGTLGTISGQQTQVVGGELTHSSPKTINNGSASWQFTWQAPSTPGPYTVRAVGNAVNNNGQSDPNDQWNFLQSVTITVKGITITAPTPSQILCAGSSVTLQWTSYGVSSVIVAVSSDGGNTFTTLGTLSSQDGQNSQTVTLPSTLQPGNQYRIRLTDASDNSISSTTQNLTVAAPTSITTHPQSATVCDGATVTFSVTANGSNLTYRWRRNGTDIPGATSPSLVLTNVTQANAGTYDCVVSGACGPAVTSNAATLTVNPPTTITAHPQSATVCQGTSYTFSVTASGGNLRYQWRKDNQDISGATSSSYTITSVALADTGYYSCVISGDCGTVTSNQAQLQVAVPPAITSQPQSQTLCEGENLTLTVSVNRSIANSYVWKKNGVALNDGGRIQGTRTATLRISTVQPDDAGSYTVEITNSICQASTTSNAAQITVVAKPRITVEPQSQTVTHGGSATLSVTATGDNLSYQWYKNNTPIAGATTATYRIASAGDSDAGTYYVVVSNQCGSVESRQVTITVTDQPTPVLELQAAVVQFPAVRTGVRQQQDFWLYNRGTASLQISAVRISGADSSAFAITLTLPATIAARDSLKATITFTAVREGSLQATLEVVSTGGTRSATLQGSGRARAITPATLALNTTQVGSVRAQTFIVRNLTERAVEVDSITIIGADAAAFSVSTQPSLPATLRPQPADSLALLISFQPQRTGTHTATLRVHCKQQGTAFTDDIQLSAEAVQGGSVAAADELGIRVYPNPATDAVLFDIGGRTGMLTMTDVRGATVHRAPVEGTYHWQPEQSVATGVYFAQLQLQGGITVTIPVVLMR